MKTSLPILMLLFFSFLLKAEIPISEKNALLSIKASANVNNNWSDDVAVEDWTGVSISQVNGEDHVTALNLSVSRNGDNYIIELDSEIANLNYLNSFRMSVSMGSMDNIGVNIDLQNLVNLNLLKELEFSLPVRSSSNVYIIENLESINQLVLLENLTLKLNDENLSFPDNLSNLTSLKSLIYNNPHDTFPNSIFDLIWLEELELGVRINDFPNQYENLPNMINLKKIKINSHLYQNLSYLPSEFYNLPSLEWLSVANNLSIYISNDISNYTNQLKYLSVDGSQVSLSNEVWDLESLETLMIYNRSDSYYLSPLVENSTSLKSLSINSNYSIELPSTIKNVDNLEYLHLHPGQNSNYVAEMYEIPNLKTLVAYYYDGIPESIGTLTNLEHLQVTTYGNLSALPQSIGNLSNLKRFDLLGTSNSFSTFPDTYFNWPLLEEFWTMHSIDYDFTNKFQNMPNLYLLALELPFKETQNARGVLNLCNNQDLRVLVLNNSNITEIDFRNNQRMANNSFGYSFLTNNNINKILVDDIDQFYNWVNQTRIRITENPTYEVLTSNEPCTRTMQTTDLISKSPNFYPNPAKDYLTFVNQDLVENVEIYSIDGKKYDVDFFSNKIDVRNLPTGVYMIKWTSNGMYKIDKFIKK